jgi:hypothetical protein
VVKQAVEDRGGDQAIVEDAPPLAHAPVAGDQNAAPFVPAADQHKEQVPGMGFQGKIAKLIDDQQLGLGEVGQPLLQSPVHLRLAQNRYQGGRRDEQD